eukprot:64650-Hanusia_phi.AAC.1
MIVPGARPPRALSQQSRLSHGALQDTRGSRNSTIIPAGDRPPTGRPGRTSRDGPIVAAFNVTVIGLTASCVRA